MGVSAGARGWHPDRVLPGLIVLLLCQLVGELVVRLSGLEVPGPVVGMLVFLVVLRLRRPKAEGPETLTAAPALLLRHLQLLFVPAGVGVVVYLDRIADDALPLAAGLWLSWLAGLVLTGAVVQVLVRWRRGR